MGKLIQIFCLRQPNLWEVERIKKHRQPLMHHQVSKILFFPSNCSQRAKEPKSKKITRKEGKPVKCTNKLAPQKSDSANTVETSESLVRLAHEALQIGEILGVRVIGDKQAAISKITKPLKGKKAQGGNQL